ncbi:MAG: isopenicillin N synthase family oxygenase [Acidobacteria bacterium]|nr:isopenicillin N synthase family oxygenase [Acidobacteriota bacterium]
MDEAFSQVPLIDLRALLAGTRERHEVARQIGKACRQCGFFYITGHGVAESLQQQLETLSREFFAQPLEEKLKIRMALGGSAWRGYFAVGEELTAGKPDCKEGLYFGAELDETHPLVKARTPMHGRNLFPAYPAALRQTVLDYMHAMTTLGHQLMAGIALSLDLEETYFAQHYTQEPLTLFRLFHYPADRATQVQEASWGVGEHTDYGVLTILKQDETGGLQVKSQGRWLDAPPLAQAFICNIGDMLDRMTGGLYRSTPHRVQKSAQRDRLSFPFFFDPNFFACIKPLEVKAKLPDDQYERWDHASVYEFTGTYGEYLLHKVAQVFPLLRQEVL